MIKQNLSRNITITSLVTMKLLILKVKKMIQQVKNYMIRRMNFLK